MSSFSHLDGRHKKILRTKVKVWGKFLLKSAEAFDVNKAEELIHKALDSKNSVQTSVKLYGDGLRIGEKGVLAALHAEFVPYPNVTAFISLREAPHILALCNKEGGHALCVTIIQFKDMDALQIVCDIIDRQRGMATKSNSGTLNRTAEVTVTSKPPAPVIPAAQTLIVQAVKPPAPVASVAKAEVTIQQPTVVVVTKTEVAEERPPPPPPPPQPQPEPEPAPPKEVIIAASSSLFERQKWPFANDITQPPVTAQVIVHPSTSTSSAATAVEDDEDNHFRTSIVFGEEVIHATNDEVLERQKRMEAVLQVRVNGFTEPVKSTPVYIDAVILNYDEIDTEGTHAVFDTPDGPPSQLNESSENLRRRPNQLLVTPNASPTSSGHGNSRLVVTSFSSGRSNSPTEFQETYLRANTADAEPAYRTSTVIYRDAEESPTERPRVTYVTNQRSSTAAVATHPMQLVRLVPVSSARQRMVQPQYFTIQPVSPRENGVHLVTK